MVILFLIYFYHYVYVASVFIFILCLLPRASVWKYTQWLKKIKERNYLLPAEDSNQSPEDAQDSTAELLDNMIIGSKITNLIRS